MKPGKLTNLIITVSCLAAATVLAFLFFYFVPNNGSNIALIYILALIIIVRFTDGYLPGVFSSVIAVICVNFLFTYPYFALNFTLAGYPITFLEMLAVTLFTSTMTTNMKEQAKPKKKKCEPIFFGPSPTTCAPLSPVLSAQVLLTWKTEPP